MTSSSATGCGAYARNCQRRSATLTPCAERGVGDGVEVADDQVGGQPDLAERVGAAVDGDQHRAEVADVGPHHAQVRLVSRAARDDERVPVADPGAQRGKLDPGGERAGLLLQVAQRVLRERAERLGDAALLVDERLLERRGVEHGALGDERPVPPDAPAVEAHELAVGEEVEQRCAGGVDEPDPGADELQRARIREASGRRARDVDDGPDARLRELLRRDAVEVWVVDDRDVLGPEALDEILRPPPEPCAARDLR